MTKEKAKQDLTEQELKIFEVMANTGRSCILTYDYMRKCSKAIARELNESEQKNQDDEKENDTDHKES